MGLHICNDCNYNTKCTQAFKNNLICLNPVKELKDEQIKRFDNVELKELKEFLED